MAEEERAPAGVDPLTPSPARIYDYLLGGKDNFASDRAVARKMLEVTPHVATLARDNRGFLQRAVRFLVDEGIDQFVDIGAGLPTQGNVHEAARQARPGTRVVYVDNDPIVLAHAQALLAGTPATIAVEGDLRRPDEILNEAEALIDFDRPVAVLLVSILHFITDAEDPWGIVAAFRDAMTPGSHLVVSHTSSDVIPEASRKVSSLYENAAAPLSNRSREQVLRMFDGFELVEPGLVSTAEWGAEVRELTIMESAVYAAVGRKL